MLLVADETQDIYQRTKYWTDESMKGAGFKGGIWVRLETCYRNPPDLIPYLRQFAKQYLPSVSVNLPESDQQELNISPVQMRWIQVKNKDTASICAEAVLKMPILNEPDTFSYADIVFLVQDHKTGLKCVKLIEEEGIKTAHIFGRDHQEQKPRKLGFFMGDARVKGATIHSFKGWESCCIVLNINQADSEEDLAAIYVALSRLKRRVEGSYLTVICSDSKLEDFGKTWERFEER